MTLKPINCCVLFVAALILLLTVHCCQNLFKDVNCSYFNQTSTYPIQGVAKNLTFIKAEANNHKRIKRFIIYNGSGVVKLVVGTSFPIVMAVKKRSLNHFYNFQIQYVPPPIPLYWWSFYNTSTFAERKQRSADMLMHYDNSRATIYKFMETILKRSSNFGKECLLKVICELARAPFGEDLRENERPAQAKDQYEDDNKTATQTENVEDYGRNIFHKLINAIFTPLHHNVDKRYIKARKAGLMGADCEKTFGKCYLVDDWLQRYTRSM